jgi:AAA15 family ATPase/GTPase
MIEDLTTFMLTSITGIAKEKRKSGTDSEIITERTKCLPNTTGILLEAYLANCSTKTRTQLLLTTHDVLLMDQQLLRRDEMWVAERDATGASNLLSFSEYKDVRYDKDIRKSYLQGRMGGIPRILLGGALTNPYLTEESEGDD